VAIPETARALMEGTITSYLGTGAKERFRAKRRAVREEISDFQEDIGLDEVLAEVLKRIE
jgi:hypothetical protein